MLNLTSSFRLRNKLKERITGLSNAIESAEFTKTAGTEENTRACDGKTITAAIAEVDALMELLRELNAKIEKANTVNRDSLIILETLKAKIAFYEKLAQKCRRSKPYEFEYDKEGERVKVDKEPLVDQKQITAVLAALKKEKDALEEKINAVNFSAAVDFDPEIILSRL
jgi:hypothetical protein